MDYPNFSKETMQTYYPLGSKTFFMLILRRSPALFLFSVALIVGLFFLQYVPKEEMGLALNLILIYIALLLVVLLFIICISWLQYFRYGIFITEKNLIIKKGLIATEEIGIPFRRIRDMKIKRSLVDQIVGVSNIIVILSDFEEQDSMADESIIFLPALERKIAIRIQESILKKSQVEQIDVLSGHDNILKKIQ